MRNIYKIMEDFYQNQRIYHVMQAQLMGNNTPGKKVDYNLKEDVSVDSLNPTRTVASWASNIGFKNLSQTAVTEEESAEFKKRLWDQESTIDYVLVYSRESLSITDRELALIAFLTNLEEMGLQIEIMFHTATKNIIFVHIHAPIDILLQHAALYDIDLKYTMDTSWAMSINIWPQFMESPATVPNSEMYNRAKELFELKPDKILFQERILIVTTMLERTRFGTFASDIGMTKMIENGTLLDGYPLHEMEFEWTDTGPLTYRQLLLKYWGNMHMLFKAQPLDAVEKYFGSELALYFAWLGVYNRMLVFASIIAMCGIVYGVITLFVPVGVEVSESCSSNIPICTFCGIAGIRCRPEFIKDHCAKIMITYIMENVVTTSLATFMTSWGVCFIIFWRKKECILKYRWNLFSIQVLNIMRPEFKVYARHRRISPITGKLEPYKPFTTNLCHICTTYITIGVMSLVAVLALVATIVIRLFLERLIYQGTMTAMKQNIMSILVSLFSSFVLTIFIMVFGMAYHKISLVLTQLENPRTQSEFDNSYIYKRFMLDFLNYYCPFFYNSFIKGKFGSHPGDVQGEGLDIRQDFCNMPNCVLDMSIQIFTVLFLKNIASNVKEILFPILKKKYLRKKYPPANQWEEEFLYSNKNNYYLIDEYMSHLIQFGFLLFFTSTFPLAPVVALLSNSIKLRLDALKYSKIYKRVYPRKVADIGAWNGLMEIITYLAIIINALVIAFTTTTIPRMVYRLTKSSDLKGFVEGQLSEFDVNDFPPSMRPENFKGICYYTGNRYPPNTPKAYKNTEEYWKLLVIQLLFVISFEALTVGLHTILFATINQTPNYIKERLRLEQNEMRELQLGSTGH